jgi:large subunit ribosomal protein L33
MRSWGEECVSAPPNALRTTLVVVFFPSFCGDLSQLNVRRLSFRGFAATIFASLQTDRRYAVSQLYKEGVMASKKGNRIVIKLRSTESGHTYTTLKNRKNDPNRLELRRYDPTVRKHVAYRETK